MKKHVLALAAVVLATGVAHAQSSDTLAKIKSSGSITQGVRESSGALAYTPVSYTHLTLPTKA